MKKLKDNRKFFPYVLFGYLTGGIYCPFALHGLVKDIKEICKEDGIKSTGPFTMILLTIVTLGLYPLFWYYRLGDMLRRAAKRREIRTEMNGGYMVLCYIVSLFVFGIALLIGLNQVFKLTNDLAADYNMRLATRLALEKAEAENG